MSQGQQAEEGVIYCSFREIGIILPNKRFYKCIKPDVCCDTGCCNEHNYKFGTVWQYWIVLVFLGIFIVAVIRSCCWACKRKQTARHPINNVRPSSSNTTSVLLANNNGNAAPTIRPVIGGRLASAHSVRNGGASAYDTIYSGRDVQNRYMPQHVAEALVQRDHCGLNGAAAPTVHACPWGRGGITGPGVGMGGGITEDERLELGIRAIGGNTELTGSHPHRERTISNSSTENGDLALLTHLMALDIIYHSDGNNNASNNRAIEKPPEYELCVKNLENSSKDTDCGDILEPPTYDDIYHEVSSARPTPTISDERQSAVSSNTVINIVQDRRGSVTEVNLLAQNADVRV